MSRFVIGEFKRTLDDRFRISIPTELVDALQTNGEGNCILAKERPGALSLWHAEDWGPKLEKDVALIRSKIEAGHLKDRVTDVQLLGRLLSTRHREVQIAGRGRLSIPEGFREFLTVFAASSPTSSFISSTIDSSNFPPFAAIETKQHSANFSQCFRFQCCTMHT